MTEPTERQPKYEVDVQSYSKDGNVKHTFRISAHTATELVAKFQNLELAEKERGFDAYLPSRVYRLADIEAKS